MENAHNYCAMPVLAVTSSNCRRITDAARDVRKGSRYLYRRLRDAFLLYSISLQAPAAAYSVQGKRIL
eukprot:6200091-Pleurochrysis_carterae.AAC.4